MVKVCTCKQAHIWSRTHTWEHTILPHSIQLLTRVCFCPRHWQVCRPGNCTVALDWPSALIRGTNFCFCLPVTPVWPAFAPGGLFLDPIWPVGLVLDPVWPVLSPFGLAFWSAAPLLSGWLNDWPSLSLCALGEVLLNPGGGATLACTM